jgi:hypothetical protein
LIDLNFVINERDEWIGNLGISIIHNGVCDWADVGVGVCNVAAEAVRGIDNASTWSSVE